MLICPNCGSVNIYNHDRGWTHVFRLLILNSRLVCRNCHTTWRRKNPERFSKLKRKLKPKRVKKDPTYHTKRAKDCLFVGSADKIALMVSEWQQANTAFISLDMTGIKELSTQQLGNLMEFYRKLREVGGDMIISNTSSEVNDYLSSLNLGYMIASSRKIVP
jgi:anti-anti-sigma regulatory factor